MPETYAERRDRRIAAGLCTNCGKAPPASGIKFCETCRAKDRERTRRRRSPSSSPTLTEAIPREKPKPPPSQAKKDSYIEQREARLPVVDIFVDGFYRVYERNYRGERKYHSTWSSGRVAGRVIRRLEASPESSEHGYVFEIAFERFRGEEIDRFDEWSD